MFVRLIKLMSSRTYLLVWIVYFFLDLALNLSRKASHQQLLRFGLRYLGRLYTIFSYFHSVIRMKNGLNQYPSHQKYLNCSKSKVSIVILLSIWIYEHRNTAKYYANIYILFTFFFQSTMTIQKDVLVRGDWRVTLRACKIFAYNILLLWTDSVPTFNIELHDTANFF